MYLKRMELFGFKSFADKTELEFGPGIVAVIGPNGCGKSNLVDAVRWALGEQSVKVLRGSRMEEIIFSGSESRKPLNFAEVSLTFAGAGSRLNLDYDEITVTRRLFRSGESEYFINKSPCRLKDITELFLDTGMGKDIYSVIGQGRVEEIINSKPEERREIFEEAAGILKYKLRKKEARRRLEETRENLVRVQDLIYELERQIEPLQAQAAVTRRYRALQEQIETAEKKLLTYKIRSSKAGLARVEKQLQEVEDALAEADAAGGRREALLQELRLRQQEYSRAEAHLERELHQLSREIEQQEGELRLLREREERFLEQRAQAEQRLGRQAEIKAALKERQADLEVQRQERIKAMEEEEGRCRRLREELADLEKSSLLGEVEERQQRLFKARSRQEAAEATMRELAAQLERLQERKAALRKEIEELQRQQGEWAQRRKRLEERRQELTERLRQAESRCFQVEEESGSFRQELVRLQQREQRYREELRGIDSRLQLLREQEASLSGYYRGVREVLQAGSALKGIIGPVVDLLAVEDRYLRAIEIALGGGLQFIVTETENAAVEAIRYLKAGNRGWATFLPLDTLRIAAPTLERYPGWRGLEGVVGLAAELVEVDPLYRKAVNYLLGNVAVCRDIEAASRLARHINYSSRIVTLDGDVINPGGALRGGSVPRRNAGQPLGRRREIEALERERAELAQKKESATKEAAAVEENLERLAADKQEAESRRAELARELEGLRREEDELAREERMQRQQLQKTAASLEQLQREMAGLEERRGELCRECREREGEIAGIEKELAGKKELYQRSMARKRELESSLTDALVKLNGYREQEKSLAQSLKATVEEWAGLAEERRWLERNLEQYAAGLAEIGEKRGAVNKRLQELLSAKAELAAQLEEQKKLVGENTAVLLELEEEEKRMRTRRSRLEKQERRLALEQARLQSELNYRQLRYRELFGTAELVELEEDFEPESCEQRLQALKEERDALGEVNLGAIEELARLQERIDFLAGQQEDLRKGELSLRKVLAEIDQRMEYFFKSTFDIIAGNMQQVYSELFGGGRALLQLTDDNILEAGIEIVAQPPGKKLQNLSLLSTGEKVLTAVALLFAILRHKPAPFYLLDEVESALDDVNLARFIAYLKRASGDAQFILITHRKRTMEEADYLYGVTMPESGVSRLVSVRLDELAV